MKTQYIRLMDVIHRACLAIAGVCIVVITLIIPWGVFTRYVLNSASSWPEPMAILIMIVLSFFSAVVCYREYLHIGVGLLPAALDERGKAVLGWLIEACMMATNLFLFWYGIKLVHTTWYQSIAEFPIVSVGVSYLPVPMAGAITVLFIIERFLTQEFFRDLTVETTSSVSTE
jgi:TRAP-type C4-dicarboxylate transport system permease small subunit